MAREIDQADAWPYGTKRSRPGRAFVLAWDFGVLAVQAAVAAFLAYVGVMLGFAFPTPHLGVVGAGLALHRWVASNSSGEAVAITYDAFTVLLVGVYVLSYVLLARWLTGATIGTQQYQHRVAGATAPRKGRRNALVLLLHNLVAQGCWVLWVSAR
jgi:hypothetical protein